MSDNSDSQFSNFISRNMIQELVRFQITSNCYEQKYKSDNKNIALFSHPPLVVLFSFFFLLYFFPFLFFVSTRSNVNRYWTTSLSCLWKSILTLDYGIIYSSYFYLSYHRFIRIYIDIYIYCNIHMHIYVNNNYICKKYNLV